MKLRDPGRATEPELTRGRREADHHKHGRHRAVESVATALRALAHWAVHARTPGAVDMPVPLLPAGFSHAADGRVPIALVYELLDAHADTARLSAEFESEPAWRAHVDYLRALQRRGREVLARLSEGVPT